MFDLLKTKLKGSLKLVLSLTLILSITTGWTPPSYAALPAGNAITDGKALLRDALPIDNKPVRELQKSIEDISNQLRANKRWGAVNNDLKKASRVIDRPDKILASVPASRQAEAKELIGEIKTKIESLRTVAEAKDKEKVREERAAVLDLVGDLEQTMVKAFPYEVPSQYSNLPQLKGHAKIAIKTNKGDMTVEVDGYSAPVTAGNFVDLVQRGFYDGLEFTRSEESYVLQTGKPKNADGFIDPKTNKYRAVPFEVLVEGDKVPTYGVTLEESGSTLR